MQGDDDFLFVVHNKSGKDLKVCLHASYLDGCISSLFQKIPNGAEHMFTRELDFEGSELDLTPVSVFVYTDMYDEHEVYKVPSWNSVGVIEEDGTIHGI